MRLGALMKATASAAVWGVSFVATKVAVKEMPPTVVALVRFAIASAILLPAARTAARSRAVFEKGRAVGLIALCGILGVTLAFLFENWGLVFTSAAHGSVIVSTTPLASLLVDSLRAGRLPGARVLGGFLMAFVGVLLLISSGSESGSASLGGDLLVGMVVVCWVAYSVVASKLLRKFPEAYVTGYSVAYGTVALVPFAALEAFVMGVRVPGVKAVAAVLFLAVFCSALAYRWWNAALSELGVATTNLFVYLIPVVGVAAGVLLLGEELGAVGYLGAGLAIAGVALASSSESPSVEVAA